MSRPQASAVVFQAGQAPKLGVDGKRNVLAVVPGVIDPVARTNITDTLEYGRGNRGTVLPWKGPVAFLGFKAGSMTDAEMEAMTAALIDPRRLYGIGEANTIDNPNRSPVGQPITDSATAGSPRQVNVAAAGFDQNPADALSVTDAVLVEGQATVTVPSSTDVRYTPDAGVAQSLVIENGLRDPAGKRSRQRLYATVAGPAPEIPPPITGRERFVNSGTELRDAFAGSSPLGPLQPGDTIWCNGTVGSPIVYSGNSLLIRNGVIVRAVNLGGAIFSGDLELSANDGIAYRLLFTGAGAKFVMSGNRNAGMRCIYRAAGVLGDNATELYRADNSLLFCEFDQLAGWGVRTNNGIEASATLRPTIHRCYFHDTVDSTPNDGRESVQFGQTAGDNNDRSNYQMFGLVNECFFIRVQRNDKDNEVISLKSSQNSVICCVMDQGRFFTIRHGRHNQIISCLITNSNGISVFGADHILGRNSSNVIHFRAGNHYQSNPIPNENRASAERCKAISNTSSLVVGSDATTNGRTPQPALNSRIENHTGQILVQNPLANFTGEVIDATLRETGTTYGATASQTFPARITLNATNTGPTAPWLPPPRGPRS